MDELYFEEGYVTSSYFAYVANAKAGFTPYIAEGYLPTDFFEDRGSFASLFCDAEIVVGMLLEAQAYLSGTFSTTASVQRLLTTSIALTSSFTQTAIGTRGKDTDLFAFSDAAIAVAVDRIRDNNIAASVVFDIATDFVVERSADVDVDAIFSAIISGLRSRDVNLETQAAFSFVCSVDTTKVFAGSLASESSITLTPSVFRNVDSTQNSEFTQTALGDRFRDTAISLNAEFTVNVTARQIRDAHLTGTGVAAITCAAFKTTDIVKQLQAQSSIASNSGKRQLVSATLPVYASVFVSRNVGEPGRPRNLIENFVNGLPSFSTTAKFGTHSLAGGNNFILTGLQNNFVVPTAQQSFYLELWHYPTDSNTNREFFLMFEFFIISQTNTGKYRFQGRGRDLNNSSGTVAAYQYTHTVNYTLNQWNHLAIVKQGNSLAYYINGTRVYFYGYPTATADPNEQVPIYGWGSLDNQTGGGFGTSTIRTSNIICRGGPYLLDEVYYVQDSTLGFSPSSTTITVPTGPRTNSTGTQFLYHFNNDVNDDVSIQHLGSAVLTAASTLTSAIGGTFNISAGISSQATVTAIIGTLEDINLVAFTDAAVTAVINVIRNYNAALEIQASVSTNGVAVRDSQSSLSSEFAITASADRIRFGELSATGNFAQSADPVKTVDNVSALSASSSVTAVIGTLEDITLVAFTDAAVNTIAVKIAAADSNINSEFTQTTLAVLTADAASTITSAISQTAINGRIRNASADLSAQGSTLSLATEFQGLIANLSSRFYTAHIYYDEGYLESGYHEQFETDAVKTASGSATLQVTASLTVSVRTDVFAALITTSQASVSATVVKTASADIAQAGAFSTTGVAQRTASGVASTVAAFTVFCNGVTAGEINLVAFSTASISATANATKPFSSSLSSQTTFFANTQDSLNKVGEADINSQFSIAAIANFTVDNVIVTQSVASSLSVVVKSVAVLIPLDSNCTLSVDASRTRDTGSTVSALITVSALAVKTTATACQITAESTLSASARKIANAVITTEAVASTLTANIRIAGLFIDCAVVSTVSVSGIATKRAVATIATAATVSIITNKIVSAAAGVTSTGSLSATIGVRKPFTAGFTSALTFVVAIRDLRLDEIVYVIPGENYTYVINSESRLHDIYGETRIRSVTGESRIRTITGESRIHIN